MDEEQLSKAQHEEDILVLPSIMLMLPVLSHWLEGEHERMYLVDFEPPVINLCKLNVLFEKLGTPQPIYI